MYKNFQMTEVKKDRAEELMVVLAGELELEVTEVKMDRAEDRAEELVKVLAGELEVTKVLLVSEMKSEMEGKARSEQSKLVQ